MPKYNKPSIIVFSKEWIREIITVRASCQNELCSAGNTFTCRPTNTYSCDNYSGKPPISCPESYSFTCGAGHLHSDAAGGLLG